MTAQDQAEDSRAGEAWLSTNEAAVLLGCHPQTVRDRCARGELGFERDPTTGHRRVSAVDVGRLVTTPPKSGSGNARSGSPRAGTRRPAGFLASVVADVEGTLAEGLVQEVAEAVRSEVAELLAEAATGQTEHLQREAELTNVLAELAYCPWWKRRRTVDRLRACGLLSR